MILGVITDHDASRTPFIEAFRNDRVQTQRQSVGPKNGIIGNRAAQPDIALRFFTHLWVKDRLMARTLSGDLNLTVELSGCRLMTSSDIQLRIIYILYW